MNARLAALALAAGGLGASCLGRMAWNFDESDRISQDMAREAFRDSLPGATGVAVVGAPPLASGPEHESTYQIRDWRPRTRGGYRTIRRAAVPVSVER